MVPSIAVWWSLYNPNLPPGTAVISPCSRAPNESYIFLKYKAGNKQLWSIENVIEFSPVLMPGII